MIPASVRDWIDEQRFGPVTAVQPVGGGCINNGARLQTHRGRSFFLKTNSSAPADMFAREAEGLQALNVSGGPRIPQVYLHGPDFILLEDLSPAARNSTYWLDFGRTLAAIHNQVEDRFGFHHDNYIGSTRQANPWTVDGYAFFGQHRLIFQANLAVQNRELNKADAGRVERIAMRLPDLVPYQPASLIHGDLWSGNALTDSGGGPALIDPAAHFGWAEAELAMTALFGSFPEVFYRSYQESRALEPGFLDRFPIYNLYHLLNHLNLFGAGYLGQVQAIIRRYG
ncbi:MAG: ketosamine-3-kinase [Chloroflexota bacterium]|nr:MAG: ketosamine-3-kinase [Chloroflexota bacterium]